MWTLGLLLLCYLLGAFPTGYLLVKREKGIDIRTIGSGGTGATNVYRAIGLKGALIVMFCDIFKGVAAVYLAYLAVVPAFLIPVVKLGFGLACVIGHNWPIFLGFKGGKGVACSCGVLFALAPETMSMVFLLWLAILAITGYTSLASLTAAFSMPLMMYYYGDGTVNICFSIVLAILVVFRHLDNIKRLMNGEEQPIIRRFFGNKG